MKEGNLILCDSHIRKYPLEHLGYFVEWGGKAWQRMVQKAFDGFLGVNLQSRQVLDIGTRYGKMACLFSLLGAKVIGFDLSRQCLSVAKKEAIRWSVNDKIVLVMGTGDLSPFKDDSFDVVFSKSVFVVVPDLVTFLKQVRAKLKPGGKIVFLENAKGSWLMHQLRAFRHGAWDYTTARYFTTREIGIVSEIFEEITVTSQAFPPIVLIMGSKEKYRS